MNFFKHKKQRKIFITITAILTVLTVVFVTCAIYVSDYYRADTDAISAYAPASNVTTQTTTDSTVIYSPENATTGFIFYPGGKVEYTAYIPLMQSLANDGIFCALVKMPFNLAVLDINAADEIKQQYPHVTSWYIGGHSLGGSMAASHISNNIDNYSGLILLGSYSTADISQTTLRVLSVYGSEDKVLNKQKYDQNKKNLPKDFYEIIIDGGCHSFFGMYGAQDGDGTPTITNQEQINITTQEIVKFLIK